jgi:hypothetical protein
MHQRIGISKAFFAPRPRERARWPPGGSALGQGTDRRGLDRSLRIGRARTIRGALGQRPREGRLGAVAEAGVCARYGALPVVSAGDAADHRRHRARRGDLHDPPASEACRGPTSHCPPGGRRVSTKKPSLGPPPDCAWGPPLPASGWGGMVILRQRVVRPCALSPTVSQRLAQQQPLRHLTACARGLPPSHCHRPRCLNSGVALPH